MARLKAARYAALRRERRAIEVQLLERGKAHPVDRLACRDQLIEEEWNHDGRLVEQERLDLAGDLLLRRNAERADELRDKRIVLRVLEVRRVTGAAGGERRAQEQ